MAPVEGLSRRLGVRRTRDSRRERLLISRRPSGPLTESFRLLAANVEALLAGDRRRALVVVSANAGDGRSLVAANLAIALSEQHRVLLVEEDERTLSRLFLSGNRLQRNGIPASLRRSVLETNQTGIYIRPGTEGLQLLHHDLASTIDVASADGMYTIIDSPPASQSSDAFLLAQRARNVLYVVRKDTASMEMQRQIRKHLERLNANIIGLVLNEF
jgi:Mrp family chromosome partitioning ATPase